MNNISQYIYHKRNISKLDCGLDQSPTVMVGETQEKQLGKYRGIPNPSLALVEANKKFINY